jgi:hypothetical protein
MSCTALLLFFCCGTMKVQDTVKSGLDTNRDGAFLVSQPD